MIYKFISLHEKNKIYKISYDCQQEKRHIAGYEKRNAYNNLQEKWNKLLIAVYKEKTETSYSSLQQKSTKIAYRLQKKKKLQEAVCKEKQLQLLIAVYKKKNVTARRSLQEKLHLTVCKKKFTYCSLQ